MAGAGPPSTPGGAETGIRRGWWPFGHHDGIGAGGPIPLTLAAMRLDRAMTVPITSEPLWGTDALGVGSDPKQAV